MSELVGDNVVLYFSRSQYETPVKHYLARSVLTPASLQ
jgi:hypothetical protein